MTLIDTNVILRYLLDDIPEQADKAESVIKQGSFTLPEIIAEVVYVLTKLYKVPRNEIKSIVRHEIKITLEDIIKIATKQLKAKGKFYIVHRSDRLIEIINYLNKYNFGIKKLQFVYSSIDANSSMVLIEAKKDCKNDVKVLKPIIKK